MPTSLRACIQFLVICGACTIFFAIATMEARDRGPHFIAIAIGTAVLVPALALLIWERRRPPRQPDILGGLFKRYFDHEGFCFGAAMSAVHQVCGIEVCFQNRFERECEANLALLPPRGFFLRRADGASIRLQLQIPGGAFGVARIPIDPPPDALGKHLTFEAFATVRYPQGRGKRLRFRPGLRVGKIENPSWERLGLVVGIVGAAVLHPPHSKPAKVKLTIPIGAWNSPSPDDHAAAVILWNPGDPEPALPPDLSA